MERWFLVIPFVIGIVIQATWSTGGKPIPIETAPFMASVMYKSKKYKKYVPFCGGSIIHERFILTAAHCFRKISRLPSIKVLVGSRNLYEKGRILRNVQKKFCQGNYTLHSYINDICLLKLTRPLQFGPKVAKVDLPNEDLKLESGTEVNVTGWGATEFSEDMINYLRQATIPIVSQEVCRNDHIHLSDNEICAGSRGRDACRGDSGGPLTYKNLQIGLASYGEPCSPYSNGVGVYTRVSSYMSWINDIISNNLP